LEKIEMAEIEEVAELQATERGANGFGSTGIN
jgi:dUTPase